MRSVFYQPQDYYCYNSDSIFLYDFATKYIKKHSQVLEVGSGCGVIGLLLARDIDIKLTQIEIQDIFYNLTKKNASINAIKSNVIKQDFLHFEEYGKFDVVISNPPFYHQDIVESKNNSVNICKINKYLPMDKFFKKVSQVLNNNGVFVFCYDSSQIQNIMTHLKNTKLTLCNMVNVFSKEDRISNISLFYCKKNSKSLAKIEQMVVFDNDVFSDRVNKIYKKANTYTIKCKI